MFIQSPPNIERCHEESYPCLVDDPTSSALKRGRTSGRKSAWSVSRMRCPIKIGGTPHGTPSLFHFRMRRSGGAVGGCGGGAWWWQWSSSSWSRSRRRSRFSHQLLKRYSKLTKVLGMRLVSVGTSLHAKRTSNSIDEHERPPLRVVANSQLSNFWCGGRVTTYPAYHVIITKYLSGSPNLCGNVAVFSNPVSALLSSSILSTMKPILFFRTPSQKPMGSGSMGTF